MASAFPPFPALSFVQTPRAAFERKANRIAPQARHYSNSPLTCIYHSVFSGPVELAETFSISPESSYNAKNLKMQ